MKLYATIENEKGKKEGMGGENGLIVDLSIGNKRVATVRIYKGNGSEPDMLVYSPIKGETVRQFFGDNPENTAKKQKGENIGCLYCKANGNYPCSEHDGSKYE